MSVARKDQVKKAAAAKTPFVLLSYQQAWVADEADVAVWRKSRRIGASWCDAARKCLVAAAGEAAGGMDGLYIGYSQDMAREYIDILAVLEAKTRGNLSREEETTLRRLVGDLQLQFAEFTKRSSRAATAPVRGL